MRLHVLFWTVLVFYSSLFAQSKKIIGYYTSWSMYARNYHLSDVPINRVTHLNYAFANIANGQIALGDAYADIDRFYPGDCWDNGCLRGNFHRLQILKAQYPHLKTMISVGGWTWSNQFSDVALTTQSRRNFAISCASFIHQYQFDGVDIDWEYPVGGGLYPGRAEDEQNFTLLLAALREKLDSLGNANSRDYYLSIAAPAGINIINHLEVEQIHPYLDWINLMSYDFHGPWGGDGDAVTNFNSPLHMANDDPTMEPFHSQFNTESAVETYLSRGVPPAKLNVGLAFYGKGFGNVSGGNNGLFASYSNAAPVGTWENGTFDYWDLAANYINRNGYSSYRHAEAMVPWLYNPTQHIMISYDDSLSIADKGDFINERGLGGAMFWEFSGDRNGSLLNAIYRSFACQSAHSVSVFLTADRANMQVHFSAPEAGEYQIWTSVFRDNDGNPDGGEDGQWTMETTIVVQAAGNNTWIDPSPIVGFKNYVALHRCDN